MIDSTVQYALKSARTQLNTLGTPDDPINNLIIGLCDRALSSLKPFRGRIENWSKHECEAGLGYLIRGQSLDHPYYAGDQGFHTSFVVSHDLETGMIETNNSRYKLVGEEIK